MKLGETEIRNGIRGSFEASYEMQVQRAKTVDLQQIIPNHWFSSAASECISMFVAGHFYGCISISQSYVEALSKYLCEKNNVKLTKGVIDRWDRLTKKKVVTRKAATSAKAVFNDRNDFHHLNMNVPQEYRKLERRAQICVNHLYMIESSVFQHSFDKGRIVPKRAEYWPEIDSDKVEIYLRKPW